MMVGGLGLMGCVVYGERFWVVWGGVGECLLVCEANGKNFFFNCC